MVKASKFIVLAGGLLGIIGFFLPFISAQIEGKELGVSAFQVIKGIDLAEEVADEAAAAAKAENAAAAGEVDKARSDFQDVLGKIKAFLYAVYAPALLMLLFGILGAVKHRFGRGVGVLSLLLGLLTLGVWALLSAAAGEAGGEAKLGLGAQLLLATGIGGALGGLVATIKPDRGEA